MSGPWIFAEFWEIVDQPGSHGVGLEFYLSDIYVITSVQLLSVLLAMLL